MRHLFTAILLFGMTAAGVVRAGNTDNKHVAAPTVRLETSSMEQNQVALVLHDDATGSYHHFILEKSHDGIRFFEVGRSESSTAEAAAREVKFKDIPFDKTGVQCVFYRVRAVDELGWFDFTNTVSVMKQDRIARKQEARPEPETGGRF